MGKLIWDPSALEDLELIAEFISKDSPDYASLFIQRLLEIADRLIEYPYSGRIISELKDPNRREIIYGSYCIMYQVEDTTVWITGVVHTAKDWKIE